MGFKTQAARTDITDLPDNLAMSLGVEKNDLAVRERFLARVPAPFQTGRASGLCILCV
jgi:hypothetical protein